MSNSVAYNRKALRRLRETAGVGIEALAQQARLSRQAIMYIERGMTEPKASTLAKLAAALDVSIAEFFTARTF